MSFFFRSSDNDEKGKFFPEPSAPYFSKASFFSISSKSLILKDTFLLSIDKSAMAQSIRYTPVNLEVLVSAVFIAILDFLIGKSISHTSGLTIKPLESVEMIFTVIA